MKFTNALSIFTAPFPLPFMGEDEGKRGLANNIL